MIHLRKVWKLALMKRWRSSRRLICKGECAELCSESLGRMLICRRLWLKKAVLICMMISMQRYLREILLITSLQTQKVQRNWLWRVIQSLSCSILLSKVKYRSRLTLLKPKVRVSRSTTCNYQMSSCQLMVSMCLGLQMRKKPTS